MDPVLSVVVDHLRVGDHLLKNALSGLSLEELHRRGGPDSSSMIWIAGHLALSRVRMLKVAGSDFDFLWSDLFAKGASIKAPSCYPEIEDVLSVWDEVGRRLRERLGQLEPSVLYSKSPHSFPVEDKSVRGSLAFFVYHESYHIGQMGYLRKVLGYESLVG